MDLVLSVTKSQNEESAMVVIEKTVDWQKTTLVWQYEYALWKDLWKHIQSISLAVMSAAKFQNLDCAMLKDLDLCFC